MRVHAPPAAQAVVAAALLSACATFAPVLPAHAAAEDFKIQGGGASTLQSGRRITITRGVNLDNTDWEGENLKGVAFQQSVVRSANFKNANLFTASFFDADLSKSNFVNANMEQCNLEMADLSGADLSASPPARPKRRTSDPSASPAMMTRPARSFDHTRERAGASRARLLTRLARG